MAKDANHIYYAQNIVLPGADPATFGQILSEGLRDIFAEDKDHVYFNYNDVHNPRALSENFVVIPGADPKTFVLMDSSGITIFPTSPGIDVGDEEAATQAKDANHSYTISPKGRLLIDRKSFTP